MSEDRKKNQKKGDDIWIYEAYGDESQKIPEKDRLSMLYDSYFC